MKTIKKDYKSKQKIIIQSFPTKKNMEENMEEVDAKTCLKKINRD